ncbi:MAG: hypothetical protein ABMA13_17425 [Chthoniobacteraceae bacterium]
MPHNLAGFDLETPAGQLAVMVIKALDHLGGAATRSGATDFIGNSGWFQRNAEDLLMYPADARRHAFDLPRWRVLVAFGRWHAVEKGYVDRSERNNWQLEHNARPALREIERGFANGTAKSTVCFLWTPQFKAQMDKSYVGGSDSPRPEIYRDMAGFMAGRVPRRVLREVLMMLDD